MNFRNTLVSRIDRLKELVNDPSIEPESSSYQYEHRVQLSELKRTLELYDQSLSITEGTTQFHNLAELPTGQFTPCGKYARVPVRNFAGEDMERALDPSEYVKLRELRRELLREEYREYRSGEIDSDIVEIVDGLLDVIVIAWGTLLAYVGEEKAQAAAGEVVRSNLSKVDGTLGPIVRREDGKLLKPEGWTPPDIKGALGL